MTQVQTCPRVPGTFLTISQSKSLSLLCKHGQVFAQCIMYLLTCRGSLGPPACILFIGHSPWQVWGHMALDMMAQPEDVGKVFDIILQNDRCQISKS